MKKKRLTLGSLFDGSGGFPLGGVLAGITPVWCSEIEPFPIRVTTARFPNMEHLGNITELNGTELIPVDIIIFGSTCQDMSVAGNLYSPYKSTRKSYQAKIRCTDKNEAARSQPDSVESK